MSTDTDNLTIAAFLDKIRALYPYGIAQQSIITSEREQPAQRTVTCVFIVVTAEGAPSDEASGSLLEGIYSKALKLRDDECLIRTVSINECSEDLIADLVRSSGASVAIVFGGARQPGTEAIIHAATLLFAEPVVRIGSDASVKKEFWRQLQKSILPRLAGG